MAKTIIGKVGMTLKRQWDSTTAYVRLDTVTHEGRSYAALKDNIGVEPTLESEVWQLLADKGHFTEQDKEEFKQAVVTDSKTKINEHTEAKKNELDNYTSDFETSLKNELDTYEIEKEAQLDIHKTTLETEMTNTKDSLVEEIENAQNGFNDNVTAKTTAFNNNVTTKTTAFNNNVTEKTNTFNSNAETKIIEFNSNSTDKLEEYNNNSATKLEEYNSNDTAKLEAYNNNATEKTNSFNSNAETKTAEFNENAESYKKRISELETEVDELSQQMPWRTTEISSSIHVEDAAKWNGELIPFGNMRQETREGYNLFDKDNANIIAVFPQQATQLLMKNSLTTSIYIKCKHNTNYTITKKIISSRFQAVTCVEQPNTNINYTNLQVANNSEVIRIASGEEDNYLLIFAHLSTEDTDITAEEILNDLMITEGTEEKPFEQYGAMPSMEFESMPVVATGVQKTRICGKNCYDISKFNTNTQMGSFKGHWIYLKANTTYTISTNIVSNPNEGNGLQPMLGNPQTQNAYIVVTTDITATSLSSSDGVGTTNNKTRTITTGETGAIFVGTRTAVNALSNMVNQGGYIQIEEGNIATDYEACNGEDITLDLKTTELAKIIDANGNVVAQDRPVYRNVDGAWKWQWEKNVGKDTINSFTNRASTLISSYVSENLLGIVFNSSLLHKKLGQIIAIVSNKLKSKYLNSETDTTDDNIRNTEGIALHSSNNNQICITLEKTRLETEDLDGIKKFILANNIVFYYPLKDTQYEDCTTEQSAALDKLYKLSLEKGTNNIFIESENGVTCEMQLEYMQDSNLIREQEHKNFEDRLTAVENLLSTTATSAMLLDNLENDLESEVGE